jgi:DNA modification methylase
MKIIDGEPVHFDPGVVMGPEFLEHRDKYAEFIAAKSIRCHAAGLTTIPPLHPAMFPHQRDVTGWALRLGKAAAFLGTGLGKTLIELEWARVVAEHTGGAVLVLAPLAVARQTVREADKFGVEIHYCREMKESTRGLNVTNYERLAKFDPTAFDGIVLDESSILKSFDGTTRSALIEAFRDTPYRLAATATPAPNDYMELGNHAEFLGVMTATEMLSTFFVHDGGETQKWRLKGHARKDFWKWVCTWAVSMNKPSDIGHDDSMFILPPLVYHEHVLEVSTPSEGFLFAMPAESLGERLAARRSSVNERVQAAIDIVAEEPAETWLLWSNLNDESKAIAAGVPKCIEVTGTDTDEFKIEAAIAFCNDEIHALSTKARMFGYGMNLQNCSHQVFVGVNDSWEMFYQAVRRSWRFGQKNPVHVHIIAASTEGNVLENLKRKEKEATHMADEMVANMQDLTRMHLRGTVREQSVYERNVETSENWTIHLADCVDLAEELPSNSVHYSVFSPPFASLYTYSSSERDMGNSRTHDEFWEHYKFLIKESYRVMMPGRLVSIHCMNLPTSKVRDGVIGIRDFRGEIIRAYEDVGFIYHSEVCIWKDPVTAMQRTKALGLLHKTIRKDSAMSRQGVPDYLVTMRKPGENPEAIAHTKEEFPVELWQNYASPVWMDINPSDTLQYRSAREHEDERHICPLQLEVIRRAVKLWTNPGDTVWSPFAGIGSEGFVALEMGRKFIGSELKPSYFRQAHKNLASALSASTGLFAGADDEPVEIEDVDSVEI